MKKLSDDIELGEIEHVRPRTITAITATWKGYSREEWRRAIRFYWRGNLQIRFPYYAQRETYEDES